jgi:hypothetical protein
VAARLIDRAEHWPWGSARARMTSERSLLDPPPVRLPPNWIDAVNEQPDLENPD